ncbi:PREDICTED: transmembrane protein 185B-like [Priapulus caudatus]|uniref:Transmembrane protein 185B-like n=1 Tax=Priapulus caudatus TaxID=37621 RepID=A0ABM1EH22_PRICU|nr:PREDICTED: transmembrane protein 185B-like [Priapulus caudatus]
MNVKNLFQGFNPSKLLVYACLLLFSFLLALKLDGNIAWSYWGVFMPIWFWKFMAICGASVGSYIWWRNPQYRCLVMQQAENVHPDGGKPALEPSSSSRSSSSASIAISVLHLGLPARTGRSRVSCSVPYNMLLQFIFIPSALDRDHRMELGGQVILDSATWIVLSVALIGVLYAVHPPGALVLLQVTDINPGAAARQRLLSRPPTRCSSFAPCLACRGSSHRRRRRGAAARWLRPRRNRHGGGGHPGHGHHILLCNKLDGESKTRYVVICLPLYLSLFTLMVMSFGSKGGNHWWFGIRKDFCQFLLGVCPLLQEYGNISYTIQRDEHGDRAPEHRGGGGRGRGRGSAGMQKSDSSSSTKGLIAVEPEFRPVVPVVSIETPD